MKKLNIIATALLIAVSATGSFAQQITDPAVLWAASPGGARILSTQGNTPASPAIGFQSSVSSTGAPQEDGGGGNGIFRPLANTMAFATASQERMRIDVGGNLAIGTTAPTARLAVETTPGGLQTAIIGKGISTGVYGEAKDMMVGQTEDGIAAGWVEAVGVFGKGTYASSMGNGNVYGVVGSAAANNPLNNIGVYGEAKNASGYNSGVLGSVTTTSGIYNTGVGGTVALSTSAAWSRAIAGYAPVAPNHYAGYFDGNVEVQTGSLKVGNVATPVGYKMYVEQGILTEKVKVAVASSPAWADYVFAADYKLKSLSEVEKFIDENNHLPNIPSADELVKEGLDLGKMQALQMEKIEELTLYLIEMKKEIEVLKNENIVLKAQITKN